MFLFLKSAYNGKFLMAINLKKVNYFEAIETSKSPSISSSGLCFYFPRGDTVEASTSSDKAYKIVKEIRKNLSEERTSMEISVGEVH